MPRLLYLFSAINLIIGSSAFVLASIVEPLARDLGVSVAAAGQATTAYAVGTALLAPMLLLATGRWTRKRVLLLALGLFTLGNALSALSRPPGPAAAGAHADGRRRGVRGRGRRHCRGTGGAGTARPGAVAGVPGHEPELRGRRALGSWLGLKFGWATPVWGACGLSALAFLAVALRVPRDIQAPGASFAGLGALLGRGDVLSGLGVTLLYFGAIFCVFSYIGPVLRSLAPLSDGQLSLTLMMFGVSGVIGTLLGGWATDRFGAQRTLRTQLGLFLVTMSVVPLTQGRYVPMLAAFMCWGVCGFGMMAPQQSRLVAIDLPRSPVLLSLNSSMMYFGMALGAALGGALLPAVGFERLAWVGAPLALAALGLLWGSAPRTTTRRAQA